VHRLPPGDAIDDDCTVPNPGWSSWPHGICIDLLVWTAPDGIKRARMRSL
jgi:hypothetical protein